MGLNQQFSVRDIDEEVFQKPESLETSADSKLLERIRMLVNDEKIFLYPNLKVSDLAVRLHTNRNYIYHAINVEMGVNFSDYINRQRIEYAARMMREHPEQPINELYIKTGFSSSSAFYRNFRHYMGCTPKEYVEKSKF